ncbi:MAG: aminotransferase class I/II-fold pyridoxal phosphate-dependent enzyme [Phycisphaerae bacterium]|mgnify:CR=1 FL=1|nr:aminotransferase class I/II-fold pyridoxal phosphate-dependent enzyme [Phycisphaerae bacterium]
MDFQPAERLRKLPPYPFADLRRKKAEARKKGVKVIAIDIGDPDMPTPDPVIDELCRAVRDEGDPNRHRYGCDVPVADFPQAVRDFYQRRWGVALREDQVVTTSGSKDAIAQMGMALLNPGDVGIAPTPGYPTYNIAHVFASAVTYYAPLLRQNGFLVDFDAIPLEVRRQAKILWLNYPNNPTTATADLEFFKRAVEFGRKHDILIAHDSAYSENVYDGYRSPSILQVDGAEDVAVEFFSLSKGFNMTGWRVGAVAGNASAVKALASVKDNVDNGTLRAVQFAAAKALNAADELTPKINAVYQKRRDMVVEALRKNGWSVDKPKATIYIWAPVPERYKGSSGAFAAELFEKTGVSVTPGLVYGQWGEGFYRISLTYSEETLREALDRIMELRA